MVVLTKIFGMDQVHTKLFINKDDAIAEAKEDIKIINEDDFNIENATIKKGSKLYIVIKKSNNPMDYIEYVISECTL